MVHKKEALPPYHYHDCSCFQFCLLITTFSPPSTTFNHVEDILRMHHKGVKVLFSQRANFLLVKISINMVCLFVYPNVTLHFTLHQRWHKRSDCSSAGRDTRLRFILAHVYSGDALLAHPLRSSGSYTTALLH